MKCILSNYFRVPQVHLFCSLPFSSHPPNQKTSHSTFNNLNTSGTKQGTPQECAAGDINVPSIYIDVTSYINRPLKLPPLCSCHSAVSGCDVTVQPLGFVPACRAWSNASNLNPLQNFLPGERINL